ncbi:MAG: DOMON-like domain-containing protein, partial [Burkholderiaceae bacterium]|nr:DOMON-like domain-containing protein [Burkholderiaceae bacterium]
MPAAPHLLQPHPATPCAAVDSVGVTVALDPASGLARLSFALAGDLARLYIPDAAAQPGPAGGLWRHTCFEAFIGPLDAPDYREFNFAPSGHWAACAFSAERVPAPASMHITAPRIACRRDARMLTLEALLPLSALTTSSGPLRLGLTTVIETADGALSYWALS